MPDQKMLTVLNLVVNMIRETCTTSSVCEICTLIMNEIFIWAPKMMRQMATGKIWISISSCTNFMFVVLEKSGCKAKKSVHFGPIYFTPLIFEDNSKKLRLNSTPCRHAHPCSIHRGKVGKNTKSNNFGIAIKRWVRQQSIESEIHS